MMKTFTLWLMGLAVAALLLADIMPSTAVAAEAVPVAEAQRQLVAQAQQPRRRTLMDFLFGGNEEPYQQEEAPVVKKPVVKKPRAALPPPVPTVPKAEGATRLAVFGDTLAIDVGKALERLYLEDPNIAIITQGVSSSGLVRPDYFNWPKTIDDQIAKNTFDIAVIIIGINDRQAVKVGDQNFKSMTPEWAAEYSKRAQGLVEALKAANKPTIWVGLPPMAPGVFAQAMVQINEMQRLAAFGGGAEFLDIYDRFLSEEGNYSTQGPDLNGNRVRMRKDDGIHFSTAGADKLAFYLSQSIKTYYRGGGTVGIEVADPLLGTDAQLMLRPPYQGLGQMKLLEVAGAVIPLSNVRRRAAELVTAETADVAPGFDMNQLIFAPVGRADAFGVGKLPPVENPTGR